MADIMALERAATSEDGWQAIPEFDRTAADVLRTFGRSDVSESDPVIAPMRQEVALTLLRAVQRKERARLAWAADRAAEAARGSELESVGSRRKPVAKALPTPSLTIRSLYNEWKGTLTVVDKEKGRLDHQIRRLIDVVGDKPANHLTRPEIREFMALATRFPGRKRTAEMNALPMRQLIEKFEADNAAIVARNAARKLGEPLEAVPGTLSAATVGEWFSMRKRG